MAGAATDRPPLCRRPFASDPALQCIGQERALTTVTIVCLTGDLLGHCRGQPVALQVVQQCRSAERASTEQLRRASQSPGVIIDVAVADTLRDSVLDRVLSVVPLQKPLAQSGFGEIAATQKLEGIGERRARRSRGHIVPAGPNPSVPVAAFLACMEDTIPRSWSLRSFGLVAAAIATSSVMKPSVTSCSSD